MLTALVLCLTTFGQCEFSGYAACMSESSPCVSNVYMERQIILNTQEPPSVYVTADLAGYRTVLPVISGLLPTITKFQRGQIIELKLDYGCGHLYSVPSCGVVRYNYTEEVCSNTREIKKKDIPINKDVPMVSPLPTPPEIQKRVLGVPGIR